MITFSVYLNLDEDIQTQVLSIDGVDLELKRNNGTLDVELYALYNFYVEIFFDKATEEPLYLKPFRSLKKLEPYLKLVEIAEMPGLRH